MLWTLGDVATPNVPKHERDVVLGVNLEDMHHLALATRALRVFHALHPCRPAGKRIAKFGKMAWPYRGACHPIAVPSQSQNRRHLHRESMGSAREFLMATGTATRPCGLALYSPRQKTEPRRVRSRLKRGSHRKHENVNAWACPGMLKLRTCLRWAVPIPFDDTPVIVRRKQIPGRKTSGRSHALAV